MQDYELRGTYASAGDDDAAPGIGWVTFAIVLLGLAGIWSFVEGILAISSSKVFGDEAVFVFGDLSTWGWIAMSLGIIQGFAAVALLTRTEFARWSGIFAAGLSALGQLLFVPVYVWWALAMFAVDVLVIYGLAVHGGRPRQEL
jgi:hypothetical protein